MNFKNINSLLLNVFILVLLTAFAIPQGVSAKKKPQWVKERPNDSAYYIGIAMAQKTGDEREYVKTTRAKALKQMSSEIKVRISSNSVLHQLDNLAGFQEEYEAEIRTSVEQTLEGYEVETWQNRKEYWVMVRISKDRYKRMQQMKLDMAKSHAFSYYRDAQKAIEKSDVFSALNYLSKAVESIEGYLDKDLTYRSVDGIINLGTSIYGLIQDIYHRVELTPVQKTYSVSISKQKQMPIEVTAKFYTNSGEVVPLPGLPLNFTFSKGEGILNSQSATNRDGVAKVVISRLISKSKTQEIKCSFDFSMVLEANPDIEAAKVFDLFFPKKMFPSTYIALEIQKSKAFLLMEEVVFGESSAQESFLNSVKTILNESVFTFTNSREEADFIVTLKSDFIAGEEKKGNGYSLFIVFASFNITIADTQTGEEIFSDGYSGIRGMRPGSYEYALKDARKNALEKFRDKIIARMEQLDM